jgi:hypothetical protein
VLSACGEGLNVEHQPLAGGEFLEAAAGFKDWRDI